MHRFRMRKSLFLDMVRKITQKNSYFLQRENACGRKGFHPIHKCVVAMRMLAYGSPADSFDDTYRMPESTVLETVKQFARTIISVYESEFLRLPTASELETILQVNEARGFPGMIGKPWKMTFVAFVGLPRWSSWRMTFVAFVGSISYQ